VTLLVLMYHRARQGPFGNAPEMLEAHFAHMAAHYHCVLPGERLAPDRLNVCLSFDDAYEDFYQEVFPRLSRHRLRAVLAVAPGLIAPRLIPAADAPEGQFCTWDQLREMSGSGIVEIAAHGYLHGRMDDGQSDLEREIELPQTVLSEALGRKVSTLVFPYGRFSREALERARWHYSHLFRIGGADNRDWSELTYRIPADQMETPTSLFSGPRRLVYRLRHRWNRLRGR
jgi:peptidoglycan/xylan/chitin deacetylase (PgdA/CDA1 family)